MAKELIKYLHDYGIERLEKDLYIKVKRHSKIDNLVLFKYSQIDSPMGNKVVQQCRGIILDEANNWNVVSYPYNKFFNREEGHAADIDWESARVYEKLDGSLMTLYYYPHVLSQRQGWNVATSGMPDADGLAHNAGVTFADLFWKVWDELGYKLPRDTNVCYMFELMTPFNRIVVRHKENRIALHGARRLSDFKELNPIVEGHHHDWEVAKTFPMDSWDSISNALEELDPTEGEGFVVVDANYNRVKVKSAAYVLWSRAKDTLSTRDILEKIRANENDEFLPKFLHEYPEYFGIYNEIKSKYEKLLGEIEGYYDAISHIDERKDFAFMATKKWYSGALFGVKFGKISSVKEYLAGVNIKLLESQLNIQWVDL